MHVENIKEVVVKLNMSSVYCVWYLVARDDHFSTSTLSTSLGNSPEGSFLFLDGKEVAFFLMGKCP